MAARYLIWDFDATLGYREGGMWTGTLLDILADEMPGSGITYDQLKPFLRVGYPWHTPERPHPELDTPERWWEALYPVLAGALTGVGVPRKRADAMARQFPARYVDLARWRLFPDTLPALTELSAQGWRHVLLTNHVPELPAIIDHLGLTPHLDAVFNSAHTGYEKPHPQAFRLVLDHLGAVEAVWMIGDNPKADVAGAEAMGIPAILVRTAFHGVARRCADLAGAVEIVGGAEVRMG